MLVGYVIFGALCVLACLAVLGRFGDVENAGGRGAICALAFLLLMVGLGLVLYGLDNRHCESCDSVISREASFCTSCGESVPDDTKQKILICESCGAECLSSYYFCPKCGSAVQEKTVHVGDTCLECGSIGVSDYSFCINCGADLMVPVE